LARHDSVVRFVRELTISSMDWRLDLDHLSGH
jgi:hypothetical protein